MVRGRKCRLRDGYLVIEARAEESNGKAYTSGRINTRDRVAFATVELKRASSCPMGRACGLRFGCCHRAIAMGHGLVQ